MLLKALFLLIILYYVVRATRSLLRAVRRDAAPTARERLARDREPAHERNGSSAAQRLRDTDVEDAKWVDL